MKLLVVFVCLWTANALAYSVLDSMYEASQNPYERVPASDEAKYCLIDHKLRIFAKSCYSSLELCQKRLEFWRELPSGNPSSCYKL